MDAASKEAKRPEPGPNGRTRGPGRPKVDEDTPSARERILRAASELFCRYGINAIGIEAILDEAQTAKTTLYKTFGSKEALVREVLMREGAQWRQQLFTALDSHEGPADDKLLAIFDVLRDWFSDPKYYGCPFINAVGEHDKLDDSIREITLMHKSKVLGRIERLAQEWGAVSPERLAHEFAVIIDGAIVAALITRDPKIADVARRTAEAVMMRERREGAASPGID